MPACSQPVTVATANSTVFCNVSCADFSAWSARATSAIALRQPMILRLPDYDDGTALHADAAACRRVTPPART